MDKMVRVNAPGASGTMRLNLLGDCPTATRCKDCRNFRTCCAPKMVHDIIKNGK